MSQSVFPVLYTIYSIYVIDWICLKRGFLTILIRDIGFTQHDQSDKEVVPKPIKHPTKQCEQNVMRPTEST